MRLKKIKLAGFKSFVDPTTIYFPSNLLGIVGPNGCGKSNVIDAVRWVMGESSAKTLRGESMADVIFSGSNSRKPVGTASVELVFDNREGKLGGQYAGFNEISVKRMVSRDGTSHYHLNNTRCRRRDITDVFLGTGLGARSYAIIEQGMVSKLIEAKPEELRIYLEEAAGISKYKERRRETENRIKHTRENLERLTDLRDELEKQLNHLKRQSESAEKYKTFKQEERQYQSELLALRWKGLDEQAGQREQTIKQRENDFESAIASQRALEAEIEKLRANHAQEGEAMNAIQGRYYQHGSEVTRLEAAIKHALESRQQQQEELDRLQKQLEEVDNHLAQDKERLNAIEKQLEEGEPQLARAQQDQQAFRESLGKAEQAMQEWQQQWDQINRELSSATQSVQVETTRIDHINKHVNQLADRLQGIHDEQTRLGDQAGNDELLSLHSTQQVLGESESELQISLEAILESLAEQRAANSEQLMQQDDKREALQHNRAEMATLLSLQKAAYGGFNDHVTDWLSGQDLTETTRLGQSMEVDPGWEKAVEVILGHHLEAVCVDDESLLAGKLTQLEEGRISLIRNHGGMNEVDDDRLLLHRVRSDNDLSGLLNQVYAVEDLEAALALRPNLPVGASVVTRDGICLGQGWVRVSIEQDKEGILQREQRIKQLEGEIQALESEYSGASEKLQLGRDAYRQLEETRDDIQDQINALHSQLAESRAEISSRETALAQINERAERLVSDVEKIREQIIVEKAELGTAQRQLTESRAHKQQLEDDRNRLTAERDEYVAALESNREQAHQVSDQTHQIAMQIESLKSQKQSMAHQRERMQDQQRNLQARKTELEQSLSEVGTPLQDMEASKETLLTERQAIEAELSEARNKVEAIDHQLREQESSRHAIEQTVQDKRAQVEQARMAWQEIRVRCQGIEEQLGEKDLKAEAVLAEINPEATEDAWAEELGRIERRISRLGPINLAAIDEFKIQSERKEYLDMQNADLTEALDTLESAIRKIDRETRTRFKDTFDQVNDGMKKMFPRLFGGGHGYLELTGEDLLETGVTVMARPPGKRNSSIHLLSGGEKAMTAVSLLFSLFHLNPAPFCMLDEIDAPLDDANVGRFCEVVREMAEGIQFIVVTHSKMTMEMVSQLTGVTMQEPGVSHLVSVDIDEAVQMVG